jgi:EmrB/QacA subfamily drug resistance transporter
MSAPTRSRRSYVAVIASGGALLAMLDSTVTNLAIAALRHEFRSESVTGLSWIISAYAVMFAALLAPSGKLADALGRRRLFVIGVGLFTLASLLCAVAPSIPVLIAARALQGAGAAAMIPTSLAILLLDGPADRRARSFGLWTAASAAGAAVGPSVGGVLITLFGWRSVFLINIPFGVGMVIGALRLLAAPGKTSVSRIPDLLATALIAVGIGVLTLGVTEGGNWGWQSGRTLASLTLGPAVLVYAVLRSRRQPVPAIDTELWGNRTYTTANVVMLLYGMAQYSFSLATVLYLTGIWRFSELQAGLANSPGAISAVVVSLSLGRIAPKLGGPRFAALFGLLMFGACCAWLTFGLTTHPAFLTFWLPACFFAGTGLGATTMGVSASAALSAPPAKYGSATGLNTTARQFGGALGVATMATILEHGGSGHGGTDAYSHVFVFCLSLVAVAFVVAAIWLRLPTRPAPVEKATSPAAGAERADAAD